MSGHARSGDGRPLVSILVPAYNEAGVLSANLARLGAYLDSLADRYRWEIVIVDDGSGDDTGALARQFQAKRPGTRLHQHRRNLGLGRALRTGFRECGGQYIVVVDIDLTYAPEHIGALLERIGATGAEIVVASPYMKGGRSSDIPLLRRLLSRWGNRFLAMTARGATGTGSISTLTGMVRAYDAGFIRALNLTSAGPEINTEIVYKAMILGARVEEIPAHIDWRHVTRARSSRTSMRRLRRGVFSGLFSGYIIRPFAFFIIPAGLLALGSLYPLFWVFYHVLDAYQELAASGQPTDYIMSAAVAQAFRVSPHAFIVGGITVVLSMQLFSLGILALQVKHSFEELFHFGTRAYADIQERDRQAAREDATTSPPSRNEW